MNNFFDNKRIIDTIWKRKVHLVIIGFSAILLAAFFSSPTFIKPKFKSTARIYPTNLWTLSDESESEQMLEIVNSQDIKLRMFDAFNLPEVYRIPRKDPHFLTYMLDRYNTNVGAYKTEYETVEIKVLDQDPKRASDMCDSIIHFYNLKVREMHRIKNLEMVQMTTTGLEKKYKELDTLLIQLDAMREKYGILDYNTQAGEVTRGYMEALATGRGSTSDAQKIKNLYDNLSSKGAETHWLETRYNFLVKVIDSLTVQHEVHLNEANKVITYCHVVQHPLPADKKSYPVRWLIVLFSTLSAVFLASLVFLVLDYRKENK